MTEEEPKANLFAEDLILLLLYSAPSAGEAHGELNGATRLEKLLFLADKEAEIGKLVPNPFSFKPYDYGPYSKDIYEAIDLLEEARLLEEERVIEGMSIDELEEFTTGVEEREGVERRFRLTPEGRDVAALLAKQFPDVARRLATIKQRYGALPLRRLIRYVYTQYPAFAEASKIRDQVL
jgi:uncharacterized protein